MSADGKSGGKKRGKPNTDAWGIDSRYKDAHGKWRQISPETHAAILKAMSGEGAAPPDPEEAPVRVVRAGEEIRVKSRGHLVLEDGRRLDVGEFVPADVPLGYHRLRFENGEEIHWIVCPPRCHLPAGLRTWGWAVQLYALRSRESWGIGDLADLRRLAEWSRAEFNSGILLVNPLHAANPILPQNPSPYFPSTRRYLNPIYLRVEEAPGAKDAGAMLERFASVGRSLNQERRIDRDTVFRLKLEALRRLWVQFEGEAAFDSFCASEGTGLRQFATFCVLAEQFGANWRRWPQEFRHPDSPEVPRFAEENLDRVRFHEWMQWLLEAQLARAGAGIALVQDLPIGVDPDGADAWAWQDLLALDASVGAPPDQFNTLGQDWGLVPMTPHKLRAGAYEPFRQTIRATLRHAGGLRIDHVMGLFRLYWVPHGKGPADGSYVRYPADDLLAILALESHRAGAFVIGEDLGTVEEGVRERLEAEALLSYRLVWFEKTPPARFPEQALAAVTTHDLPTVAGLWSGNDLEAQQNLGLNPNAEGTKQLLARLGKLTKTAPGHEPGRAIVQIHRLLGQSPSMLVTATLEDALAVQERPNMPGTVSTWPNWSLALPHTLEQIEQHPLVRQVAQALSLETNRTGFQPKRADGDQHGG